MAGGVTGSPPPSRSGREHATTTKDAAARVSGSDRPTPKRIALRRSQEDAPTRLTTMHDDCERNHQASATQCSRMRKVDTQRADSTVPARLTGVAQATRAARGCELMSPSGWGALGEVRAVHHRGGLRQPADTPARAAQCHGGSRDRRATLSITDSWLFGPESSITSYASIRTLASEAFNPVLIPTSVRTQRVSVVAKRASGSDRLNLIHPPRRVIFSMLHRKKLQGIGSGKMRANPASVRSLVFS